MGALTVPKDQAIAQALTRHAAGESLRQIAPDLGISHVRLRAILLGEVPDEYKAAQADALIERIAEADELLDNAIVDDDEGNLDHQRSSVNIARAREIGKFARWDAERRLPKLFGQQQQAGATGVTISIARDGVTISQDRPAIEHKP